MFRYGAAQSVANTGFDGPSEATTTSNPAPAPLDSRRVTSATNNPPKTLDTTRRSRHTSPSRDASLYGSSDMQSDTLPQLKASFLDVALLKAGDYASPVGSDGTINMSSSELPAGPSGTCAEPSHQPPVASTSAPTERSARNIPLNSQQGDENSQSKPSQQGMKRKVSFVRNLEEDDETQALIRAVDSGSASLPGEVPLSKSHGRFAPDSAGDSDDSDNATNRRTSLEGHTINKSNFLSKFEGGTPGLPSRRDSEQEMNSAQALQNKRNSSRGMFGFGQGAGQIKKKMSRFFGSGTLAGTGMTSTNNLLSFGFCIDNDRSARAINPESRTVLYWETWLLLTALCISVVTPFEVGHWCDGVRLGFEFWLNRQADIMYFLDMLLMFRLAYFDKRSGLWVFELPKIRRLYLRGSFAFDFITCIPYDLIMWLLYMYGYLPIAAEVVLRIMRLLRVGRLLRKTRLTQRISWLVSMDFSMMQLIKYLMYAIMFAHWLACGWSLLAVVERNLESTWVTHFFDVPVQELQEFNFYIGSLYWAVMTVSTIGYGDVVPVNSLERGFVIFAMLIGAFAYGYIIGAVSGIVATRDAKRNIFYSTMDGLNSFMATSKLPQGLRVKLREYFTYKCNSSVDVQGYNQLLQAMSPALRSDVAMFMNSHWIANVKHFQQCESVFITQVALHMKHIVYPPAEVIIEVGERLDLLYIVKRGIAVGRGRLFTTGKVFGEDALYKPGEVSFTVRSLTFCDITCISSQTFAELISNFPDSANSFRKQALKSILHEEIMAYCQAYRNVTEDMHSSGGKAASNFSMQADEKKDGEQDVAEKLAEEQGGDMTSNRRVQFYESKLRMFILVDEISYAKYTRYAISIQRLWRNHVRRKKNKDEEKNRMLESFISGIGQEALEADARGQQLSKSRSMNLSRQPSRRNSLVKSETLAPGAAAVITDPEPKAPGSSAADSTSMLEADRSTEDGKSPHERQAEELHEGAQQQAPPQTESRSASSAERPVPLHINVQESDVRVIEIEDRMDAFYEEMRILKQAIQLTAVAVTKQDPKLSSPSGGSTIGHSKKQNGTSPGPGTQQR